MFSFGIKTSNNNDDEAKPDKNIILLFTLMVLPDRIDWYNQCKITTTWQVRST